LAALLSRGGPPPLFDHLISARRRPLTRLAQGGEHDYLLSGTEIAFAPDFSALSLSAIFRRGPSFPLAASRGCYWGKCASARKPPPTHPYRAGRPAISRPFAGPGRASGVRDFHLTDNAIPVTDLKDWRPVIPSWHGLRWHGFVALNRALRTRNWSPASLKAAARCCNGAGERLPIGPEAMAKGTNLAGGGADPRKSPRRRDRQLRLCHDRHPGRDGSRCRIDTPFLLEHAEKIGFSTWR